jgi:hypothetical protein
MSRFTFGMSPAARDFCRHNQRPLELREEPTKEVDPEEDPCEACHYQTQACAYIMDGEQFDDACASKKRYLRHTDKRW